MKGIAATCALLSLSLCNGAWGNGEQSAAGGLPASLRVHSCCVDDYELESALYEAAEAGQRETVLLLLEKGALLSTGISGAARGGHRDIVNLLLEKGACPNDGLAGALMGEHADIAEQMLELGADPTEPLWRAAFHDKLDMMRLLLEHGANPDIAIMEAASYMQMDMVKLLLERGADPTHGLSKAARRGNTDMVKLLLEHGADPESGIEEAVREVHADVVAMLHKAGAPLDRKKLLPMAVQGGDTTIVKTLLEHGTGHVKVLALAVEHGRTSVVKLLLEHGEVPGGYELRSAAQYGYADILKLLLPLTRSEINTANWLGWTPLRLALKRGDCECVRLLLEYGADANETGSQGCSLLDYALQLGHEECASLLRDATGNHGK